MNSTGTDEEMRNRFSAERRPTCGDPELDEILFSKPCRILIYGEAAAGKTNFILNTIKLTSMECSGKIVYISTEGSSYIDRVIQMGIESPNVLFAEAVSQQHLLEILLDIYSDESLGPIELLAVDSLNNFYRVEATTFEGLRTFLSILAILTLLVEERNTYVLASAQVRAAAEGGEEEPSGMQYLSEWSDVLLHVESAGAGVRRLIVEKPSYPYAKKFEIVNEGIRWKT